MRLRGKTLAIGIVVVAAVLSGFAHDHDVPKDLKSENGLILSWYPLSTDDKSDQINISDDVGRSVTSMNILRLVPEAHAVSIYDVSTRGNLVAVAAVYDSKAGRQKVRPTAALLLFNLRGDLLSSFAIAPSRAIRLLVIDDHSNIWTLTDGAGKGVDPSTIPMIVEYASDGKVAREMLMRNLFPFHATDTREDVEIGAPMMGYDAGVVWFWLPGSTDLVTISTNDDRVAMTRTLLPQKGGHNVVPLKIVRDQAGHLVAQVGEDDEKGGRKLGHYLWSADSKSWTQFRPGNCEGSRLIGASDKGQVYRRSQTQTSETCIFHEAN